MPEQISKTAADRLKALCDRISVAHDMDPEIRRELCAHMEDELLAYTSGRQHPTEEDALILVEKHFGDPAVIRSLLRNVHCTQSNVSLLRRLLGLGVVTGIASVLATLIWAAIAALFEKQMGGVRFYIPSLLGPLLPMLLWCAGIWWTRNARRGHTPWFERAPVLLLLGMIIALCIAVPTLRWATFELWRPAPDNTGLSGWLPVTLIMTWTVLLQCATVAAWAWWCDWPGFGTRRALLGAAAWALWHVLIAIRGPATDLVLGTSNPDIVVKMWAYAGFACAWTAAMAALGFALYRLLLRRTHLLPAT